MLDEAPTLHAAPVPTQVAVDPTEVDPYQDDVPKTKAQVMAEVIAKSKLGRAQRAAAADALEDLRETLDADFAEITSLLQPLDKKAVADLEGPERDGHAETRASFDATLSRLRGSQAPRARASMRLLPPEEQAAADKASLEALDAERERRKAAVAAGSAEAASAAAAAPRRPASASDDFRSTIDRSKAPLVYAPTDAEEFGMEPDFARPDEEEEEDEGGVGGNVGRVAAQSRQSALFTLAQEELPDDDFGFVVEVPATFRDFADALDGKDGAYVATVVARMRVTSGERGSRSAPNALGLLLQYIVQWIAAHPTAAGPLWVHLHALALDDTRAAVRFARTRLVDLHRRLVTGTADTPTPSDLAEASVYLRLFELTNSRKNHVVLTPLLLMLCSVLAEEERGLEWSDECRVGGRVASMLTSWSAETGRLVPQVTAWFATVLRAARRNLEVLAMAPVAQSALVEREGCTASLVVVTLRQARQFATTTAGMAGAWEALEPTATALAELVSAAADCEVDEDVRTELDATTDALDAVRADARFRRPLALHIKAPTPIRSLEPDFDDSAVNPERRNERRVNDAEEVKRLKKARKRAMSTTAKEIRKDNFALATARLREKAAQQNRFEKSEKAFMGVLQSQQGEAKKLDKMRDRIKGMKKRK
jgi:nucleolar protein 14